jgi:hypothetical protein
MARKPRVEDAMSALKVGNRTEAIKLLREATGIGPAEAKAALDAHEKEFPTDFTPLASLWPLRGRPGAKVPAGLRIGAWVAIIALAALAIYFLANV